MNATQPLKPIPVPRAYGRNELARLAYRIGFKTGYGVMMQAILTKETQPGPVMPEEYQGRKLAVYGWHEGLEDGKHCAAQDALESRDLLEAGEEVLDAQEAADGRQRAEGGTQDCERWIANPITVSFLILVFSIVFFGVAIWCGVRA